jgi:hypothetical protein
VLELSMRTTLANHSPTIVLQHLDYVANLHNRASCIIILPAIMPPLLNDRNRAPGDVAVRRVRTRDDTMQPPSDAREQRVTGNRGVNDPKQARGCVRSREPGSFTPRFLADLHRNRCPVRHKTPP